MPASKKRKAPTPSSEVHPTPSTTPGKRKLTKKEKEEARERARQWAIKEGVVADSTNPVKPSKKRRLSTPASTTTTTINNNENNNSIASPEIHFAANAISSRGTTNKKSRAPLSSKKPTKRKIPIKNKRSRKSEPLPQRSTAMSTTTPSSSTTKKTKKQQLKEGQERAAAWAAAAKIHKPGEQIDEEISEDDGGDVAGDRENTEDARMNDHDSTNNSTEDLEMSTPPVAPIAKRKHSKTLSSSKKQRDKEQLEARARAAVWAKEERVRKQLLEQQQQRQEKTEYQPPSPILSPQYDDSVPVNEPISVFVSSPKSNSQTMIRQRLGQSRSHESTIINDTSQKETFPPHPRRHKNNLHYQQEEHQQFVQQQRLRQLDVQKQTLDELDELLNASGEQGTAASNKTGEEEEDKGDHTFLDIMSSTTAMCVVVLIAIAIALAVYHSNNITNLLSSSISSTNSTIELPQFFRTKQKLGPPCFQSSFDTNDANITQTPQRLLDQDMESCIVSEEDALVPCPAKGVCSGGYLQSCAHSFLTPTPMGDECILTKDANETLAKVETILVNNTAHHVCSWNDGLDLDVFSKNNKDDDDSPPYLFDLENLLHLSGLESPSTLQIVLYASKASPIYRIIEQENTSIENEISDAASPVLLIGLTKNYVQHNLPLPFECWFGILLSDSLICLLKGLFLGITYSLEKLFWILKYIFFNIVAKYPIVSTAVIALAWLVRKILIGRRERKQLRHDVLEIKEIAYDKLQRIEGPCAVLHLRDDIAHGKDISRKKRNYIIRTLWPRVVSEVTLDNRVTKSSAILNNKPQNIWTWSAPRTITHH